MPSRQMDDAESERLLILQASILYAVKSFFDPAEEVAPDSADVQVQILEEAQSLLSNPGLARFANEWVGETVPACFAQPGATQAESRDMLLALVRAAKSLKPALFDNAERPDDVLLNVLQLFVSGGGMAVWRDRLRVKVKIEDPKKDEAVSRFLGGAVWLLGELAAGADPLSHEVDPGELAESALLAQWREKNGPSHPEYRSKQSRFFELHEQIREEQEQAGKKFVKSMADLKTVLQPGFDSDAMAERYHQKKRELFFQVLNELSVSNDPLEPSKLRKFQEIISREQYGKLFYEVVGESQQHKFRDSQPHQIAHALWLCYQLDQIHASPQVACSRMLNASYDGVPTLNHGYGMPGSVAHEDWFKHPMARSCGDIVMDAFPAVVDFGCLMDIDTWVERLINRVYRWDHSKSIWPSDPHYDKYDQYIYELIFFVLENGFRTPYKCVKHDGAITQLKVAAGDESSLKDKAREVLQAFQSFCKDINTYRTACDKTAAKRSFVFGIGFNGEMFGCPSHKNDNHNEIYLHFSKLRRGVGSDFFIDMIKAFALCGDDWVLDYSGLAVDDPKKYYDQYKALVRYHVAAELAKLEPFESTFYEVSSHRNQIAKYKKFICEIDSGVVFSELSHDFQEWFRNIQAWYRLPAQHDGTNMGVPPALQATVHAAPAMPEEEQPTQHISRAFIFDMVCGVSLTDRYPSMAPWLFQHWQAHLIEQTREGQPVLCEKMRAGTSFDDLSPPEQSAVKKYLDSYGKQLHHENLSVWKPGIEEEYKKFVDKEARRNQKCIEKLIGRKTKNLCDRMAELGKAPPGHKKDSLESTIEKVRGEIARLEGELANISFPLTPGELPEAEYKRFKESFFCVKCVDSCVEPSFARVLGHDRFYPVSIANNPVGDIIPDPLSSASGRPLQLGHAIPRSVIAPCGLRCQFHAAPHVLTGDACVDQSADRLDSWRETHGHPKMPSRLPGGLFAVPRDQRGAAAEEPADDKRLQCEQSGLA